MQATIGLLVISGFRLLEIVIPKMQITHSLYQQRYCIFNGFQRFYIKIVVRLIRAALHVSFDTKLACSFLYIDAREYAGMGLFTVNMAHFCIIRLLSCKSGLCFRLSHQSSHPVFSPISCHSRVRCGVFPVSVDKC